MTIHENSLANLQPGFGKKLDAQRVGIRLSRPARLALDEAAKAHAADRTREVERIPELWLTLRACLAYVPAESNLGKRLDSLRVQEVGDAIATAKVLDDDEGDCSFCGSTGYDRRVGPDCDCLACEGRGDFDQRNGI